jgi:hypothetical protein
VPDVLTGERQEDGVARRIVAELVDPAPTCAAEAIR